MGVMLKDHQVFGNPSFESVPYFLVEKAKDAPSRPSVNFYYKFTLMTLHIVHLGL